MDHTLEFDEQGKLDIAAQINRGRWFVRVARIVAWGILLANLYQFAESDMSKAFVATKLMGAFVYFGLLMLLAWMANGAVKKLREFQSQTTVGSLLAYSRWILAFYVLLIGWIGLVLTVIVTTFYFF